MTAASERPQFAVFDIVRTLPGAGHSWAWCPVCGDTMPDVRFGPMLAVVEQEAWNAASKWAYEHRCHPSGRTVLGQERRDDHLNDRWAGDVA